MGPRLLARARRIPDRHRPGQVLATGGPDRPGVRRPQPVLCLPADRGLRLDMEGHHLQAVIDRYQAERRLPSIVAAVLDGPEIAWSGSAGAQTSTDTQYRI